VSCISSPWSPRRATVSRMHVVSVDNRQPHEELSPSPIRLAALL
jgi:hypothetical protein